MFFDQEKFSTATPTLLHVDVETFGGKRRENGVKTSKNDDKNRHTDVMHGSRLTPPCKTIRIFNGCEVLIENSVRRVTIRHHEACRVTDFSVCTE